MNEIENAIHSMQNLNLVISITESERNAVNLAIQALQEKAEREKGCEYCNNHKPLTSLYTEYSVEVDDKELSVWNGLRCEEHFKINYCPMCGRKLV